MPEWTVSERMYMFRHIAKDADTNPEARTQAKRFFKEHIMDLQNPDLLQDSPAQLAPQEQETIAGKFGQAVARTVQGIKGTEYQISVSLGRLLASLPESEKGVRATLRAVGADFRIN